MMKNITLTLLAIFPAFATLAQPTIESWSFDGQTRQYVQYVPSSYTGTEPVALVIALHGLGDNMSNFSQVGFHQVADTANIIVVTPEALVDQVITGQTAWNSGAGVAGISLNAAVDDVGFINALIDTLSTQFNIDPERVYATGFSMGGFMSNRLACELNNRIKAIASVAGTVGGTLTCDPGSEVRVCHFHGTADTQVGYGTADGGAMNNNWGSNVADWISFWNTNNGCGTITLEGQFPNVAGDGYSVEYVEYAGCNNSTRTVHIRVNGANHVWLFPNNDIFYTTEIWKFFLGLSPNNLVPASVSEYEFNSFELYPNPSSDFVNIDIDSEIERISIHDVSGKLLLQLDQNIRKIDVRILETGVYRMSIETEKGIFYQTLVKQ